MTGQPDLLTQIVLGLPDKLQDLSGDLRELTGKVTAFIEGNDERMDGIEDVAKDMSARVDAIHNRLARIEHVAEHDEKWGPRISAEMGPLKQDVAILMAVKKKFWMATGLVLMGATAAGFFHGGWENAISTLSNLRTIFAFL